MRVFGPAENLRQEKGDDSNMTTMLGLMLLLLAFFILLNAMSSLEVMKANAVLESVHKTFSGRLGAQRNLAAQRTAADSLRASHEVQAVLGHLLEPLVPVVYKESTPRGPVMILELSAGTFFGPRRTSFQPGRRQLLQRLAGALGKAERRGVDYDFALLHSSGQDAGEATLATARMAAMATELTRHGAAEQRVTVGLFPRHGPANRGQSVRFVLRVNLPGDAAAGGAG
jgi:hypothetical protein